MPSKPSYFPLPMTIVRGDDRVVPFTWRERGTEVPVDINGWDFFYTCKASYDDLDADALIVRNPADFVKEASVPGGTIDRVYLSIARAETAAMAPGEYVHDLQIIRGGRVRTIAKGPLVIEEQVTIRIAP